MDIHSETRTTYGFRDRRTGKFLHINIASNHDQDFCGSETVSLTLEPSTESSERYEVDDLMELIAAMRQDPHWFNSSRQRPSWSGHDPAGLIPVQYDKEMVYDQPDGDPVATHETVRVLQLPLAFKGKAYGTSDSRTTMDAVRSVFGDAWASVEASENDEEPIYAEIAVLDASEQEPEVGMLLVTSAGNSAQIDALAPRGTPSPRKPHERIDATAPSMRVALVRINRIRPAHEARPFEASDFDLEVWGPTA